MMAEVETSISANMHAVPSALSAPSSPTSRVVSTSEELPVASSNQDLAEVPDANKKIKRIIRRKRRPARPQVDPSTVKSEPPPQTGTIFNIWYNKWSGGDREDKYLSQTHAAGRCNISSDSGYTRGDRVPGSFFCLFFAKGLCPKGHECEYLHRLPGIHDHFNPNVDCFGRDKHSDYRDDMGGVGSFMRQNRTLYVGRIHVTDDIEEVVARHFAEWGDVERTRVLTGRGVAFVTYANEANAQFAKEAMAHQSLDHEEISNVRWATADPNPAAEKREVRRIEEQAAEAVRRALPDDFVREIEGRDPEAKKRKKIEAGFGLSGYEAPDEVWYARAMVSEGQSGKQRLLENGGDANGMLEDGGDQNQRAFSSTQEVPSAAKSAGILSNSTLSALKGHSIGGVESIKAPTVSVGASLVGYDSEDESN